MEIAIAEQAARWLIELEDESPPASLADFTSWLKASPRHVEEFLLAAAAWRRFDDIDAEHRVEVERIVSEVSDNVISFGVPTDEDGGALPTAFPPARLSSHRRLFAGVTVCAALLALAGWWIVATSGTQAYSTAIGEQRTVQLTDGSLVQVNTRSRIEVHFTDQAREIRLLEGEALFTVTHNAQRPFRVRSGATVIHAVGTEFNVRRRATGTTVSVVEGLVKVSTQTGQDTLRTAPAGNDLKDGNELAAGEEADITINGHVDKHTAPDLAATLAWRERRLVFRDDALADIVAEFNRYNAGYQIRLEGETGNGIRLTGVFRADDPEAVLLYLTANSELRVERTRDGAIIRDP